MMNILVCFKVVPDLDLLSGSGWIIDSHFRVETGFVKNMINPYDESALEIALKLADRFKGNSLFPHLTALTIGNPHTNLFLKTLRALKYNETVRIDCSDDLRFNPEMCAALITAYINRAANFDYILMGRQSGEGDNARTPLITAEMLNWPCITQVVSLEPGTGSALTVTNMTDDGLCRQTVEPPLIMTVGNAPSSYLRIPTLKDIKTYGDKPVKVIAPSDLLTPGETTPIPGTAVLQGLETIDRKRKSVIITGETAAEKAHTLYYSYLKGWLAGL